MSAPESTGFPQLRSVNAAAPLSWIAAPWSDLVFFGKYLHAPS